MKKIFAFLIVAMLSSFAISVDAAVTDIKNIQNVGIYTENENVGFEVTRDNTGTENAIFKVFDIDGNLVLQKNFTADEEKEVFYLGHFKAGWYRVKPTFGNVETNTFVSFSVIDEKDGIYHNSPFAMMHLGRMVTDKDAAYVEALRRLSVGTVRSDEIADVFKSSRPYEQYNTNLSNAGINVMPTVATNYMYPGTTTTGNIGGFTDLLEVYNVHKTMVNAYNGKIPYWELINEPDVNTSASADAFASWYKAAAIAISDTQPDAIKSFGGLCVSNSQYFDTIMQNGIMKYSDTINVHSHATDSADGVNYDGALADLGKAYSALYADNVPLWSTESGVRMEIADDSNEIPSDEALKRQARYMITSFMDTIGKHGVNRNFWFLTSHYIAEGPEYGTFSKNDMPYPAISSMNVLTDNLKDGKLLGRLNNVENAEGYFFDCGEYDAAVIWRTKAGKQNIQLHTGGNVEIIELVGNSSIKTYSPSTGRVSFDITEEPVLIRLTGKANINDYVKTAFDVRLPESQVYTDKAERVVLQQVWEPKPDVVNGAYRINNDTQYTVKCRIYNFNGTNVNGSFWTENSDGITVSGDTSGTFTVAANSYIEKVVTLNVSADGNNYSLENFAFYAEAGDEIAPSISQMRIQNDQNTDGIDITVIPKANQYYNFTQGDYFSSQVQPEITNNGNNSVTYRVLDLKNSTAPAHLYIYQSNLSVDADSDGMYFKFSCEEYPSFVAGVDSRIYFDVMVSGAEGSFQASNLFEFDKNTKNKDVFIPWSAFVHSNSNVKITDPDEINQFGFGFDKSSDAGYRMNFTISNLGTYKSENIEDAAEDINISGVANGGEYRLNNALAEITTYDVANTEIYINYEKIDCVADENGKFKIDFSDYEAGDYSLIAAVSDEFNKKTYKQVKFTLLKDFIYWK